MKLVHVNYLPYDRRVGSGQYNKIFHQARAAKELGLDFDFIIINNDTEEKRENLRLVKVKQLPVNKYLKVAQRLLKTNLSKFKIIDDSIDLRGYDKIILRYHWSMAIDFSYESFFRKYCDKVITEHHTKEISESRHFYGKGFLDMAKRLLEIVNTPKILSMVNGIIAISDDVRKNEFKKISMPKSSIVISNGVSVENIKFTKFKPFDGRTLNLIFVASIFHPWHGLERLLGSLRRYNGKTFINLFLIGCIPEPYRIVLQEIQNLSKTNVNIKILGNQYNAELDKYFSESTIAISSLALFRNKMRQGSPLKTREYIARGVPFVYACDDVDINNECDFALKVENDESLIDMEKIIEFAIRVTSTSDLHQKMRDYALKYLDWKIKIKEIYEFAQKLNT